MLAAFAQFPAAIPKAEQQGLFTEATATYNDEVRPALAKFVAFMTDVYLPRARPTPSFAGFAAGPDLYATIVRANTGLSASPEQIHEIALREVRRGRDDIEHIAQALGFEGSVDAFMETVRQDQRCAPLDEAAATEQFRVITEQVEKRLPSLFGTIPRTPYVLKPMASLPPGASVGQARSGSSKDGRPGQVLVLMPVSSRCGFVNMMLHEGFPGHLLQMHIADESSDISEARKRLSYSAFVEGWAEYAITLGDDLGVVADPYVRVARANGRLREAIRAALETGVQVKGWTRQVALDFYSQSAPWVVRANMETEVNRASDQPGRRLAYMVGRMKFMELRAFAEKELGSPIRCPAVPRRNPPARRATAAGA